MITKIERGLSFVKLLAVLVSLLSFSLPFPTLSRGADLEIRQESHQYQVPFAEVISSETFIISTTSEPTSMKAIILDKPTPVTPPSVAVFSNPIIVHFQFDSAEINPAEHARLFSLLDEFKVPQTAPLTVTGFTCKIGPATFNLWLSEERAKAVSTLLEKEGYTVTKIEGKGATQFISTLNGPNRRVEIAPSKIISVHTGQQQISTKEETP